MLRHLVLCLLIAFTLPGWADDAPPAEAPRIVRADIRGDAITPVTVRYLNRTISRGEDMQAACVVLYLDTPGGLVDSTREIVKRILDSRVPVVVYVAPSGARAASAGMYITIAAHVAAMAPATNIGAATPVQAGGLPFAPDNEPKGNDKDKGGDTMEHKVVNDAAAWAISVAEHRGRNADWVEKAVREAISASAAEAVDKHVVDFIARDWDDLLTKLEGREVQLALGPKVLHVKNAQVETSEMWWGDRLLTVLANPTLAFLLMIFGFYGVLLELYTPGWGVPGTIGVVCLVLAFFGLAVLPINEIGLAMLLLGMALLVAEAFITSHGLLAIAGTLSLVFGGLMLVDSQESLFRVSAWVVVPVGLATAAITVFLVSRIVTTYRLQPVSGREGLLHAQTRAEEDFRPEDGHFAGLVRAHGELWRAQSQVPVSAGAFLSVIGQQGLTLFVRAGDVAETGPTQGGKS